MTKKRKRYLRLVCAGLLYVVLYLHDQRESDKEWIGG